MRNTNGGADHEMEDNGFCNSTVDLMKRGMKESEGSLYTPYAGLQNGPRQIHGLQNDTTARKHGVVGGRLR